MTHLRQRGILTALLATVSLIGTLPAQADPYPARPITIVVGYPAGGSVDLTARLLAEQLAPHLGQHVVVENMGGAGGTIGAQRVARAEADGYTLLLGSTNEMVIAGMINKAVKYDGLKDFSSLGMIASQPMVLAASKVAGVTTAGQYIQKLKAGQPEEYNYGSSGIGTTLHLAGEMINESAGIQAQHVPYRGVSPLVTDLVSGQLNFGLLVMSSGLPQIQAGKITALGVTTAQRSSVAPSIPSLSETPGFEKVDISVWFGLYGPAGLPADVTGKLHTALSKALTTKALRDKLAASGATLFAPGVDALQFQQNETSKYAHLVKLAGIDQRN
ncbi:tripartite tricarboxylate transporter substrate binding protein [Pusillimonas sp. TS35]|uniref:Bug family tripartite tricarboxylate transporter substrate binding protein n=1 Tax=Paracandidimonas lactea TaxID=2895524 RepID=UPI001371A556|nr:tripartite tricarboxylate transporter substrate binding protein [Paracandidimonas lactea]MYN12844.1 tripartite tricarboxylate transporter substrate binding protein [Pusillimonas sp. TS35]